MMGLKGKKVTVVGLGNSGLNAAILLDEIGAYVRVTDNSDNDDIRSNVERLEHRNIEIELGSHTRPFFEESDLVVLSPGADDSSPAVKWAKELKIPITGEMELGCRFCKGKIIAITGTNGKTTVTELTGNILKDANMEVVVCGNVGNSLCGEVERITPRHWVVLEVSSFQLERIGNFRPHIAVILNVTDDHLDRHGSFGTYFDTKLKTFANQRKEDTLVLNHDAKNLRDLEERAPSKVFFYSKFDEVKGAFTRGGKLFCNVGDIEREVCSIEDIRLKGLHNLENVLASSLIAVLAGARASSIRMGVRGFEGLEHRLQTVDTIDGVEFVNDSKSTTVDSTLRALEAMPGRILLIAGGRDKNSDFGVLRDTITEKVKALILLGEAKEKIRDFIDGSVSTYMVNTLEEAVKEARQLAESGDCVLLSPMCASFDMFKNYKERGEFFKRAVRNLKR